MTKSTTPVTTPVKLTLPVGVEQIQQLLPHRYPFLLVDRVIEIVPDVSVVALKNVSINEPFFQGHFPGHPVMPGVLIVEAMAQTAGLLTQLSSHMKGGSGSPLFYLVKVDNARFTAVVSPGDQLRMEVSLKRLMRGMGLFEARALVEGKVVASCELMCAARSDK
jgi:3-hydroxyacyl-[acyl-carrier-protein] dehydratase